MVVKRPKTIEKEKNNRKQVGEKDKKQFKEREREKKKNV